MAVAQITFRSIASCQGTSLPFEETVRGEERTP
jgi:hypothetical protein